MFYKGWNTFIMFVTVHSHIKIQVGSQSHVAPKPEARKCVCMELIIDVFSSKWPVIFFATILLHDKVVHLPSDVFSHISFLIQVSVAWLSYIRENLDYWIEPFSTSPCHVTGWLLSLCVVVGASLFFKVWFTVNDILSHFHCVSLHVTRGYMRCILVRNTKCRYSWLQKDRVPLKDQFG